VSGRATGHGGENGQESEPHDDRRPDMNTTPVARLMLRAGEVAAEDGAAAAAERLQDLLADRLRLIGHTFFVATPAQRSFHWLGLALPGAGVYRFWS